MKLIDVQRMKLPDRPGVYMFHARGRGILYIGKATSLRDRVRSYFANDLLFTRGKHVLDMVTLSDKLTFQTTDSALEALILEAALIKKHQPEYNTKEKDDKSFNYVVITNEEYPRVLITRERELLNETDNPYKYSFGPFPQGTSLLQAYKIIRRILPFRDNCTPHQTKPCFNAQIGLCPGVCTGVISKQEYNKRIQHIKLFFEGKKAQVLSGLKRMMQQHAKAEEFEEANEYKRMIFAMNHIKDVSLLDNDIKLTSRRIAQTRRAPYRIEAYDIAHLMGKHIVGVMVAIEDSEPNKSDYRKFIIRSSDNANDVLHLEEILRRRFAHAEWRLPDLVVVDGGLAQKRRAEKVLAELSFPGKIVSVVKNERHKPKGILGNTQLVMRQKRAILLANAEAHRFAVTFHRSKRDKIH